VQYLKQSLQRDNGDDDNNNNNDNDSDDDSNNNYNNHKPHAKITMLPYILQFHTKIHFDQFSENFK
jgi:hypothetical protein